MLCSNVERFIFALSGQNLEDYCTRCNVTVTGRHTFCFLPPGPVHACVPGTWVHVPTLSVDGLIRIYMAHTAQIIYIICKILAYFLCYSLYSAPCYNSRPSNSKLQSALHVHLCRNTQERYFVVTDAANGSLPPRLFPITTLQHFKTTNQIFIDQQHARSIVKFTAILRS